MKTTQLYLFLMVLSIRMLYAQDTLTLMHHNLTNYGNNVTGCDSGPVGNNALVMKDPNFKIIVKHINPDVYSVNELGSSSLLLDRLLANVLNTDGISHFEKTAYVAENNPNSSSTLFYNKNKLGLSRQLTINSAVRRSQYYRLYHKSTSLPAGDTVFFHYVVTHLKAGTTASDASQRESMVNAIQTFLANIPANENCVFAGDFNVYRSSEAAFQKLLAPTGGGVDFIDPINRIGSWTANSTFADVHTQCPQSSGNGCFSGGGLDDRFDWIMMNQPLITGTSGAQFVTGSYKAVGNDGQHYNRAINAAPTNTSAPANVISALFAASDHLPVVAKLRLNNTSVSIPSNIISKSKFAISSKEEEIRIHTSKQGTVFYAFMSSNGQIMKQGSFSVDPEKDFRLSIHELKAGMYLLQLIDLYSGERQWFRVNKS